MTTDDIIAMNRIEKLIGEQHHMEPGTSFCYDNCPGCNGQAIVEIVQRVVDDRTKLRQRVAELEADARRCTREAHERLKLDDVAWLALEPRGVQHIDDGGPALEYRNCPRCNSTLGRDVKEASLPHVE